MVYDAATKQLILFGGKGNDTVELDGQRLGEAGAGQQHLKVRH